MQINLTKKDILNLFIILGYAYFLLNLIQTPTVLSYERAANLDLGKERMQEVASISVYVGISVLILLYLISRMIFKQSEISVLAASLLSASSYVFINNFMLGISDFTLLLLGQIITPSFGIEKLFQLVPLLPLSILSIYLLYVDKKTKYLFTALVALIASFFIPLIALPFLFILTANGFEKIKRIKDKGVLSTIAGGMIAASISIIILGTGTTAIALSILIGLVIAVVMFAFENKHTLLYLLTVTLTMISIEYAIAHMLNTERIDSETLQIMPWINQIGQLNENIAFASIYKENISNVAYVETGKRVNTDEAFLFLFTNKTPSDFNYLILDTLVLDAAKEYAKAVNTSVTFETFAFAGIQKQGDVYYQIYLSYKGGYLQIQTDANGNLLSNRIIVNGVEDSYFKLLPLNATNSTYFRYIHPRSDSGKNVFKLLYPDQFGSIAGYEIKEINSSSNSRFRLYSIQRV